eukprot:m.159035 g.159035  ORF g.159035 m.159035 type:complete len:306 (-) comp17989_c0_seq2:277-1194(-)
MESSGAAAFRAGISLPEDLEKHYADITSEFCVRQKGYKQHKKKGVSTEPMFLCVARDLLKFEEKRYNLATSLLLPELPSDSSEPVSGVPPYIILNIMLPGYDAPNPVWGKSRTDGPGWSLVFYLLMTEQTRTELQDLPNASAGVRLLQRFVTDDSTDMRERLKLIASLVNPEEVNLGAVVRKLVVDYNMKPVLTRPQHEFFTDGSRYFEIDIDVHLFGYIPRSALGTLRANTPSLIFDLGLTVEGKDDDELPETMMCIMHMRKVSLDEAWSLGECIAASVAATERDAAVTQALTPVSSPPLERRA